MKLSVIIPTYNEGENLFKAVQSVIGLQDEIRDAELIVADLCRSVFLTRGCSGKWSHYLEDK